MIFLFLKFITSTDQILKFIIKNGRQKETELGLRGWKIQAIKEEEKVAKRTRIKTQKVKVIASHSGLKSQAHLLIRPERCLQMYFYLLCPQTSSHKHLSKTWSSIFLSMRLRRSWSLRSYGRRRTKRYQKYRKGLRKSRWKRFCRRRK